MKRGLPGPHKATWHPNPQTLDLCRKLTPRPIVVGISTEEVSEAPFAKSLHSQIAIRDWRLRCKPALSVQVNPK